MRALLAALALAAAPVPAFAHAFKSGAGFYTQFTEGVTVPLADPRLTLVLIALALLVTLRDPDGLPRAWPYLFAGMLIGIAIAPLMPPAVSVATLAVGVTIGALAALTPPWPLRTLSLIGAVAAITVTALAFEGHPFGTLPPMIYIGVLFGANLALAVPAGLASLALTRLPPAPARIGLRIIASWCTAIAVMLFAFEIR